jgi:5-oxoprolinase (ATP-hydrolysing) subunit C
MSLVIVRAAGLVTVQDRGRRGHMHEALPPGGALVDGLLVAANRAASNPDDAAAVEVLGLLVVRAEADLVVATDAGPRVLRKGQELVVASGNRRVAYLAIHGGVHAPLVLGGRGTMLSAGLGAPLRAGDMIAPQRRSRERSDRMARGTGRELARRIARGSGQTASIERSGDELSIDDPRPIRVIAGPDSFPPDALAALTSGPYRISPESDRVGTRLVGPAIARPADGEGSRPMVRGAIEVPRDGAPIVLGPEHPTTGGYPIVGVVAASDLDRLFAVRLGGIVRFEVWSPPWT